MTSKMPTSLCHAGQMRQAPGAAPQRVLMRSPTSRQLLPGAHSPLMPKNNCHPQQQGRKVNFSHWLCILAQRSTPVYAWHGPLTPRSSGHSRQHGRKVNTTPSCHAVVDFAFALSAVDLCMHGHAEEQLPPPAAGQKGELPFCAKACSLSSRHTSIASCRADIDVAVQLVWHDANHSG